MIRVQQISYDEVLPFITKFHYARRIPPISYAFAAYSDDLIAGIVSFGCPPATTLRVGCCGEGYAHLVIELNRLYIRESYRQKIPNLASTLVGKALKLLPRPAIVVSYSDTAQGHVGYIYQATNFIYTGLSDKQTDLAIKGQENLHSMTITDKFRGEKNRGEALKEIYGDDLIHVDRSRKHRYFYFLGTKRERKWMREALKYPVLPYPKGESKRYEHGNDNIPTQSIFPI